MSKFSPDNLVTTSSSSPQTAANARNVAHARKAQSAQRRNRGGSEGDSVNKDTDSESVLPPHVRNRLYDLFREIEREFENLYAENLALQEKLDKGDMLTAEERTEAQDTLGEPGPAWKQSANKKSASSQLSQRLKMTYKTSTSRIVSSFRPVSSGWRMVCEFRGHRDGVWEVNVSNLDPGIIGTASADHTARIWHAASGVCLLQYVGHTGSVNSIRFHPNSEVVLTSSGSQQAHLWKAHVSSHHSDVGKLSQSIDEDEDTETATHEEPDSAVDSSDDKQEAVIEKQPLMRLLGHSNVVIAADWLGTGHVVTGSWDRTAMVYENETGEIVNTLTGHDHELTNVCGHPTQKLVLTASKDTTFRLFDLRDPSLKVNVFQGHVQQVNTAVFASGDRVVSGSDDRTVKVWDLKNMRSPTVTLRTDAAVNRLSVSSQQGLIAIPQDNRHIRLYDLNGLRIGRLPRTSRQGHTRMVNSVCWSDRDPAALCNLYSCGFDRRVFGWKVVQPSKE